MQLNFEKRITLVKNFFLLLFLVLIIRYFYIQIIKHNIFSEYAQKEYQKVIKEITPRGIIYDINGEILANSIVTWDVVIMKKEFNGNQETIKRIAEILNLSPNYINRKLSRAKNYVKIKKEIDKKVYDKLEELIYTRYTKGNRQVKKIKVNGVIFESHQKRIFPANTSREIIGLSNENRGLTQIEYIYDKYLKGQIIYSKVIKDAKGNIVEMESEKSESETYNLYLTIDSKIQYTVEKNIEKYRKNFKAEKVIAIVQDTENGFIKAIASYPQNYINFIPVEYVYEPGSTFKTIMLSAAFEENLIKEDDLIECENGKWKVTQRYYITDHEPMGKVTVKEAYRHSSNIGFAKIGQMLGIDRFYPYIKKFNFGVKYTEFPGESKGIIKLPEEYREIDLLTTSYGYGIAVNPIQLINAYTAIANKGVLIKPHFIYKLKSEDNERIMAQREIIREPISRETAERVKNMMIDVVENGTGVNAKINNYLIAGKTGTANKLDLKTGKYIKGENIASFCGFFPASKPRYTILVIVDNPEVYKYGGQTAAVIFKEIAKSIISFENIPPDRN